MDLASFENSVDLDQSASEEETIENKVQCEQICLEYILTLSGSKTVLLFWILFVIYVSCLSCCLVCSLQPCGHLLGKGWPHGSLVCDVFLCFCHFPMWCPGSGVVLDCIDS